MIVARTIRIALLMLFALLQCVAPLAHAHVNGDNADQHIHLADIDHLHFADHPSEVIGVSTVASHSSVVSKPPEIRPVKLTAGQALEAGNNLLPAQREYTVQQFVTLPRQVLPFLPYQHPCSQAPPA